MKKEALDLSGIAKGFANVIWKDDQGPFENTLRLLPYISVPFLGGIGSVIGAAALLFTKHYLGISLKSFGKEIDQALGFGPGDVPERVDDQALEDFLVQRLSSTTASFKHGDYYISKRAGLAGGAWKIIKLLSKYLPKLMLAAGTAFAGSAIEPGLDKMDKYLGNIISPGGKDKEDSSMSTPDLSNLVQKAPKQQSPIENVKDFAKSLEEKYNA